MQLRLPLSLFIAIVTTTMVAAPTSAQVVTAEFADDYTATDLGSVPGVPAPYGALMFSPNDPNILLIGGSANNPTAKIYAITVNRDEFGSVVSFGCATEATPFANANGVSGGIDGGIDVGPGGVLFYTTYSDNQIGQILPGSAGPDRLIALSSLGVIASTGTLRFVPPGLPGAGRLKILSYNASRWYDATVTAAGDGTYDITVGERSIAIGGGPEGVVYIAGGSPGFPNDSILVSRYGFGTVVAYEIDGNGDPIVRTIRDFVTGLSGVEGAAIDPLTGEFFFSTFGGGNRVIRVSGFTPPPSCPADLNLDGTVDGADLGTLLQNWGGNEVGGGELTGDCAIDGADLGLLLLNWGACPESR